MDGAVSGERVPSAATADVIRLVDQLDVDIDEFAGVFRFIASRRPHRPIR
jgi:hypothetical protein